MLEKEVNKRVIKLEEQLKEVKDALERNRLLTEVASRIRSSLNIDEILNTTVREIRKLLECDRVLVYRFEPDWNGIIVAESVLPGWKKTLGKQLEDTCFRTGGVREYQEGKKSAIDDIYNAGLTECYVKLLSEFEVKANLVVPILIQEKLEESDGLPHSNSPSRLWGLLMAHQCSGPRHWRESELELLEQLAVQIAIGLQQGELFQQVQTELKLRQQAQEKNREQEKLLNLFYESTFLGISILDQQGYFVKVNPAFSQILGYKEEELKGELFTRILATESQNYIGELYCQFIQNPTPNEGEWIWKRADGELVDIFLTVNPIIQENGNCYIVITVTDITEQKQAERSLEETTKQLSTVIETVGEGITLSDETGKFLIFNSQMQELTGYSLSEVNRCEDFFALIYPENDAYQQAKARLEKLDKLQKIRHIETNIRSKEGQDKTVLISASLIKSEGKKLCLSTYHNITKRKKNEEILKWQENLLRSLTNTAPLAFLVVDETHKKVLFINHYFYQLWNLERLEFLLKNSEINSDKLWEKCLNLVNLGEWVTDNYKTTINPHILEYEIPLLDGRTFRRFMGKIIDNNRYLGHLYAFEDITQRKQMEQLLHQQQQELRALLDNNPDLIIRFDHNLRYLYCNSAVQKYTGLLPQQFIGKTPEEMGTPEVLTTLWHSAVKRVISTGEEEIIEYQFPSLKGNIWMQSRIVPEFNADGEIETFLAIARDIDSRKQAELLWQESEALNRRILDSFPDLFFRLKSDGTYVDIKIAQTDELIVSKDELIGQKMNQFLPPEIAKLALYHIEEALTTKSLQIFEYPLEIKGKMNYYEARLVVIGNDEVLALVRNISERKHAELTLKQLNEELETRVQERTKELQFQKDALDQAAIVVITDPKGIITYANDKFCEISQYSREEILGQTHKIVNSGYHSSSFFKELWSTISQGKVWQGQVKNQAKDGSYYWVDSTIVPFLDATGQPFQYLAIRFDITQRKEAERELQASEAKYQRLVVNVPGVIYQFLLHHDGSNEFPYISERSREILEITPEEVYANPNILWKFIHPYDLASVIEKTQVCSQTLQPFIQEWRMMLPSGKVKWIQAIARPEKLNNGDIIYDGVLIDISERKQAEIALQQQFEQERLMTAISQHIRESLELEQILNTTVAEVQKFLKTDRVLVYRILPNGTGSAIAEAVEPDWPKILNMTFPEEVFPQENYARYIQGRIYTISDSFTDPILPCLAQFIQQFHVIAKLVVPIIQEDTLWGLLIAHQCSHPRKWQTGEIELMKQLANQLAIAIRQSTLYEQLQMELRDRRHAEEKIKASLKEKELLLKEIHHRVKNNLYVVSSLLEIQASSIADPKISKFFEESQNRIYSMALIHEKLYRSHNLAIINFSDYLEDLVSNVFASYNVNAAQIHLELNIEEIFLNIETATPCGLIVNELVSNTMKHAFPDDKEGIVSVECYQETNDELIHLIIRDNGIGFPDNLDFRKTDSMGFQVVCTLIEQLEGSIELERSHGTNFHVKFSELNYRKRI
jgi:PAS domain S-box-containing protein